MIVINNHGNFNLKNHKNLHKKKQKFFISVLNLSKKGLFKRKACTPKKSNKETLFKAKN